MSRKKFFTVSELSREDIKRLLELGDIDTTQEQIDAITDDEMKDIAENMGESHTDSGEYWDSLEREIKDYFKNKQEPCSAHGVDVSCSNCKK